MSSKIIHRRTSNVASALAYLKEIYNEYFQHGAEEERGLLLCTKQFEPMVNLRLLQLRDVKLEGNFRCLPPEIKWLQWKKCPLKCLPADFPPKLTVLDLSESKIERVWGSRQWCSYNNKVAKNLVVLNLHHCYNLTALPDLSGHRALEKLILEHCIGLTTIHRSIGDLTSLRHLDLRDCQSLVEFPSDVSGLKRLETLILSGCFELKELPEEMGNMLSLRELLVDETAIEKLPESIFRLTKLESLSLNKCKSLRRLPFCIGKLVSLREFSLNGSALEEIPNSIGFLRNLEKLSLMWCKSLTVLPNSVGNLESLTEFWLNSSSVKELPASIGSLSYLKGLSLGGCCYIITLPFSIERLASMVELQLDGTSIEVLPDQIGSLKSLKKLEMRSCESLRSLPQTIGNMLALNTLIIVNAAITELPESIGMLENLVMLRLNQCKLLWKLPDSFGKLKNLHHLLMEETAVTKLPENFGMLPRLMILKMAKKTGQEVPWNPRFVELPSSLSNLSLLKEFDARRWKISGKIPDDFEKLSLLEVLKLDHNDFCSLPSSLHGLSILRELLLSNCKELKLLPPLPSSLVKLNAANCIALESISDLSNLSNLEDLHLTNCDKLVDVPGLECLKSLKRLYTGGCNSCSSAVKRKLDKVALRNLYHLSMPGSEIPNWFTPKEVRFSKRKNHAIKAVIFAVVVSINHQIPDDRRDQIPATVDIQARILRSNKPVCTTVLDLIGVPNTNEDQVYLCRYHEYRGLVLTLDDGDKIEVVMRDPPFVKGVELKKCGVHMVYENDDDYGGDEESLDESQQSVSQKLTRFIESSEATKKLC
ncbi:hypothetical protein LguiB_024855 [Lonicera macranthoides]